MTSGYMPESMPEKGEPGFDQILAALREELKENPRLKEMPAEEVARQLVLGGHLQEEPPPNCRSTSLCSTTRCCDAPLEVGRE
jgi:hypothetical protein